MYDESHIIYSQIRLLSGRQMFDVELTTSCNKHCPVCPRDKMSRNGWHMSSDVFDLLCEWLPVDCDVFFAGLGEPLLHESCVVFINKLHNTGRKTSIMTNGTLLSKSKLEELFSAGLDKLQISIIQQTDMPLIPQYVRLLDDNYKSRTVFNIIAETETVEMDSSLELLQNEGIRYYVKKVHNRAGYLYPSPNPGVLQTCATFFCDTFIDAKGGIYTCSNDINGRYCIGAIDSMSFNDLLNYKKLFLGDKAVCSLCLQCTDEYRIKHFIDSSYE